MMTAVVCISVFAVVLFFLLRGLPSAPPAETEQDLMSQGYTRKEAKKEARAQRNEHRGQQRLSNSSVRTATRVASLARRLAKKGGYR